MLLLAFFVCCWILPSFMYAADNSRRVLQQHQLPPYNGTQIHYYDPGLWCSPIQPTSYKNNTLDKLRRQNYTAPMMFWHLQKAGGSSLCGTFVRSYARTTKHAIRHNYLWSANCNDQEMSTNIITNPSSYMKKYRPYGKYFVAIEPSYSVNNTWEWVDPNDFPFKYHDQPSTKLLLDTHHASTDTAWNAAVHFIAVRHPLQMAISAFHYAFQPDRDTIFDHCDAFNMTMNACLLAVIHVAEQPVPSPALAAIYQRYQDEQRKSPKDRNTAKYDQEQLQLATTVHAKGSSSSSSSSPRLHPSDHLKNHPPSTGKLQPIIPEVYAAALATADAALGDISNYRGELMRLVQQKYKIESKGGSRVVPTDDFNDYIRTRLSRKRDVKTTILSTTATVVATGGAGAVTATVDAGAAAAAASISATNNTKQLSQQSLSLASSKPKSMSLPFSEPLFSVWQEHRIRYQILGNYSIINPLSTFSYHNPSFHLLPS